MSENLSTFQALPSGRDNKVSKRTCLLRHPHKTILYAIFIFCVLSLIIDSFSYAKNSHYNKLLSLYTYNFLLFVAWPPNVSDNSHTVKIAVLGTDPAGGFLEELRDKTINHKKLVIEYLDRIDELQNSYQVLFIKDLELEKAKEAIDTVKGKSCLTMSTMPGFTDINGMVLFLVQPPPGDGPKKEDEINTQKRFRINLRVQSEINSHFQMANRNAVLCSVFRNGFFSTR